MIDKTIIEGLKLKVFRHWKPFYQSLKEFAVATAASDSSKLSITRHVFRALFLMEQVLLRAGIRVT
jgi:hypothetical protein